MSTSKSSKATTILATANFNDAFKNIKAEGATLNAALRNIAARAAADKDVKVIADWLGVKSSSVSGKALSELRNSIIAEVVYFTTSESGTIEPVMLSKVATVKDINYYQAKPCSWLAALKMICNRRNKSLEAKHIELTPDATYTANAETVEDSKLLTEIEKSIETKKAEANALAEVKAKAVEAYKKAKNAE